MLLYNCTEDLIQLNQQWNDEGQYYPGCTSVDLNQQDVPRIKQDYWFRPYLDGTVMSLCCRACQGKNLCFLVDTNMKCYLIPGRCSRKILKGTIFNGVYHNHTFHITDCPLLSGNNISEKPFSERMRELSASYQDLHVESMEIAIASYEHSKNLEVFLEHYADTFVCIPEKLPIHSGTNVNMFHHSTKQKVNLNFMINNLGSMHLMSKSQYTKTRNKLLSIPEYIKQAQEPIIVLCKLIDPATKTWEAISVSEQKDPDTTYMQRKVMEQSKQTVNVRSLLE